MKHEKLCSDVPPSFSKEGTLTSIPLVPYKYNTVYHLEESVHFYFFNFHLFQLKTSVQVKRPISASFITHFETASLFVLLVHRCLVTMHLLLLVLFKQIEKVWSTVHYDE